MLVLRVFEPVVLDRVELPLRRVAGLRAADVPEERLVVAPLRVRLLAVRLPVLRERVEDVPRADAVRLREEVERPVVRRVVEPVRDVVVLRAAVLRAVARPPLRPAAFCWAVERDLVDVLREVVVFRAVVLRGVALRVVVLRAAVLRAAVLRAVALPPLRPAAFCWAVERPDVDELRDVFDAPLVFRAVDLVRANALRLPSLDDLDRRATTESRTGRIVKTRSDVIRKRA